MAAGVRIIIYNADPDFGPELRATLLKFEGVKIIAEVDETVLLPQAAQQFPADLIIVHLDPNPEAVLAVAGELIDELPDTAVFTISDCTDGQLILAAMRMGVREFITKPLDDEILSAALEKVTQRRVQAVVQGKLITVLGAAGGVGTSTIAANLSVEMADFTGEKVAVVDLDFRFGQIATMLDVESTYTIADLCESVEQLEQQVIERALVTHETGVNVLARPSTFSQAEHLSAAHCVGVLSSLMNMHDIVVVDGPTRFDMGAKAVLDIADEILLVAHLLVPCVRNLSRMVDGMRQVGFNMERVKLICNRTSRDSSGLSMQDLQDTLDMKVFTTLPDDWESTSGAVNLGEPLLKYAPKSRLREAIRDLAKRLHDPGRNSEGTKDDKKSSLLAKIFSDA